MKEKNFHSHHCLKIDGDLQGKRTGELRKKQMKKFLLAVLVILVTASIFIALGITFPSIHECYRYWILFVIDGYLWISIRRTVMYSNPH